MATDQVFIYTMNRGVQGGAWGRYIFPFTIEHFAQLENTLYMRHGDDVSFTLLDQVDDDGVPFDGVIQWPWLDFNQPGVNKNLVGFDIVNEEGVCTVEIGYNQAQGGYFTEPYLIPEDTVPGQIIAIPVQAPSFSVRLTYAGSQNWQWNAFQLWLDDQRPTA